MSFLNESATGLEDFAIPFVPYGQKRGKTFGNALDFSKFGQFDTFTPTASFTPSLAAGGSPNAFSYNGSVVDSVLGKNPYALNPEEFSLAINGGPKGVSLNKKGPGDGSLPFWGGDSWMENGLQGLQMLNAGMNLWGAPAAHRAAMRNINTDTQLAAQRRDSLAQQSAENAAKHSAIMDNVENRRKASLAGMIKVPV
jgi:hypothetical protein